MTDHALSKREAYDERIGMCLDSHIPLIEAQRTADRQIADMDEARETAAREEGERK